jgi:hypothetical protein
LNFSGPLCLCGEIIIYYEARSACRLSP